MEENSQPAATVLTPTVNPLTNSNYASFWRRLGASVLDGIILMIVGTVLGFAVIPLMIVDSSGVAAGIASMVLNLASIAIGWGYYTYFTGSKGQTIGKMALGIKVVKIETNEHPDYGVAALREIVGKIISGLTLGIGYLWVIWDPKKQAIHDKVAGTVVVRV